MQMVASGLPNLCEDMETRFPLACKTLRERGQGRGVGQVTDIRQVIEKTKDILSDAATRIGPPHAGFTVKLPLQYDSSTEVT
jgi:hypothetical protein